VPNGPEEVEHDEREHDELGDVMKRMEGIDTSDPAFMERVREMERLLRHHASDEETDQFPKLRATPRSRTAHGELPLRRRVRFPQRLTGTSRRRARPPVWSPSLR